MGLPPETSSKKWDAGKAALRHLMLKMSVSRETSPENGDVEIAGEIFGSSKMSVPPETYGRELMFSVSLRQFGPTAFWRDTLSTFRGFPKLPSHETERHAISFQGIACRRGRRRDTLSNSSRPYGGRA